MKKTIIAVVLLASMTISMTGCSRPAAKESTDEPYKKGSATETTEVTTETTTEATTEPDIEPTTETTTEATTESAYDIPYKVFKLKGIQFKVPENWRLDENAESLVFYPDINDQETALAVAYAGDVDSSAYTNEKVFKEFVNALPETEQAEIKINKKEMTTTDDFFIGKIDYVATRLGKSTHNYIHYMCNLKTGSMYIFYFMSPNAISEENTKVFNEVVNSVCVVDA